MHKKNIKISLFLNIIIGILTIVASVIMFTGFKFMEGGYSLESTKLGMFKFFTVDSNIFIGIISFISAYYQIKLIKAKIQLIPKLISILQLMGTLGVTITFVTVFGYLGPIAKDGVGSLLKNSNLFFHLIIPILSMVNYVFFAKDNHLTIKEACLGVIPVLVYAVYYLVNILVHYENGAVSPIYDWYWFVQGGLWQAFIVIPIMLIASILCSLLLWKLNNIINI